MHVYLNGVAWAFLCPAFPLHTDHLKPMFQFAYSALKPFFASHMLFPDNVLVEVVVKKCLKEFFS